MAVIHYTDLGAVQFLFVRQSDTYFRFQSSVPEASFSNWLIICRIHWPDSNFQRNPIPYLFLTIHGQEFRESNSEINSLVCVFILLFVMSGQHFGMFCYATDNKMA